VIRESVPGALLVGDSTQPVYAGNLGFAAATPGSWFNSATGFGSLGYALPASTGASLGAPARPVVCLVGDGGLQFTLGELGVPRDTGAWVAIVVWNNRSYSEIRTSMVAAGIKRPALRSCRRISRWSPALTAMLIGASGVSRRSGKRAAASPRGARW